MDASRHVPGAGAHAIAHTLPAWPNRRVVLDHQAPEIPAGVPPALTHRISTGKAPATGFRLEVEARGSGGEEQEGWRGSWGLTAVVAPPLVACCSAGEERAR